MLVSIGGIFVAFIVLYAIAATSFRALTTSASTDKAVIASQLIKDGLTSHMVSGSAQGREFFLRNIINTKNIEQLWVARAPSLIEQYGPGFNNEIPKDDIDTQVIQSGEPYHLLSENISHAKLRFTVPYKASTQGNPNCLACHNANEGETLGVVSMVFDITQARNESVLILFYIMGISVLVMVAVLWSIHYTFRPFMSLFDSITNVMKYAQRGDYSRRVDGSNTHSDGRQVALWINNFLDKLETSLQHIQKSAKDFFLFENHSNADPLLDTKSLVEQMADIYRFKKTIEFDEDKVQVYARLGTILEHYFGVQEFQLMETNAQTNTTTQVYSCLSTPHTLDTHCRALRTKQPVFSDQFERICPAEHTCEHYLCIPYTISDDVELLLYVASSKPEIMESIKTILPQIENFIDAARPELVSKNLTEILRLSSTTDQLTGLYNRKFLDDFIEKSSAQAMRSHFGYAILMLDIDFFKAVNDKHGHDVGDKAIQALSHVIKSSIRESDVAFRYGGEEFLILLYNCEVTKVDEIANTIRTTFAKQAIQGSSGKSFTKTLSIGYALFPHDAETIWRCIKFADVALYQAKETGRNKVVRFHLSMLGEGELNATYNPAPKNG